MVWQAEDVMILAERIMETIARCTDSGDTALKSLVMVLAEQVVMAWPGVREPIVEQIKEDLTQAVGILSRLTPPAVVC